ncbi:PREDICTED: zinc finger protein 525-like [Trachymyrmex cornetzi]|uniref:zinc finger protein 525-like n=1 Tax=Trachymyrmex cornetzi TaxID=471704 RepID=UPI00084F04B5|nr:PREDICTED: zinc finger protein 525-like [Trachymyrmex cornetzi]
MTFMAVIKSRNLPNLDEQEQTDDDIKEMKKGSHVCQYCDKQFTSLKAWKQHHKEVHFQVKPYNCGMCDKTFQYESELRGHVILHGKGKPYPCMHCEETFNRKANRDRHAEAKHVIDKNYKCIVCKKFFKIQQDLRDHIDTDHPERKYKCNECPSTFTHQRTFNAHIKIIHKGGRTHLCKVCGKTFRTKHHRDSHSLVHSNKKQYECSKCGKGFKHRNTFIVHLRKDHSGDTTEVTHTCKKNEEQIAQRIMTILNEAAQQSDQN